MKLLEYAERVTKDLKGVIPFKENIKWEVCNSMSYLGKYSFRKNRIAISRCIKDEQEILNTIAHELIHACGVHGHGVEFKKLMNKINSTNLGYHVTTSSTATMCKERKTYIMKCENCGWERVYYKRFKDLHLYKCPICKQQRLVQLEEGIEWTQE